MSGPTKPRVVCFIDGSNLYSHLREVFGEGKVHLPKLCARLSGPDRAFWQFRFYGAPLPQGQTTEAKRAYGAQQRFFRYIRTHRKGVLQLGRFQQDKDGRLHEKGVDVYLAVDLVRLAAEDAYDVAIVFSGDADLVPAVETVRQVYKKRVEVAMPDVKAYHIRQAADCYHEIDGGLFLEVKLGS